MRVRDRIALAAVGLVFAVYLPIVVHRTVTLGFGDVEVFFRAGWAIWTGHPLYAVADHHGWTYHYPPTFALLMGPFAQAPPGFPQPGWALPYAASVAAWYLISFLALVGLLHVWASALERHGGVRPAPGYWNAALQLRLTPLVALLPFAGDGLGRGQPAAVLTLCMVGFLVLYLQGRVKTAAFVLALAITIKIYPAVLALIPLLRRDVRVLLWIAVWCGFLLFVLPLLALGPAATIDLYQTLWRERISGILAGTPNARLAAEVSFWSYDMESIGAMLARVVTGRIGVGSEPLPLWATRMQLVANVVLVVAVAAVGHRRFWSLGKIQPPRAYPLLVAAAVLMAATPAMVPTAQPNYFVDAIPLVGVIILEVWRRYGRAVMSPLLVVIAAATWFGMIATEVKIWEPLRLLGLATPALLALILWGLAILRRQPYDERPAFAGDTRA